MLKVRPILLILQAAAKDHQKSSTETHIVNNSCRWTVSRPVVLRMCSGPYLSWEAIVCWWEWHGANRHDYDYIESADRELARSQRTPVFHGLFGHGSRTEFVGCKIISLASQGRAWGNSDYDHFFAKTKSKTPNDRRTIIISRFFQIRHKARRFKFVYTYLYRKQGLEFYKIFSHRSNELNLYVLFFSWKFTSQLDWII